MHLLSNAVEEFVAAAHWTGATVASLSSSDWDGPGLGEWDLRALVGHTSRAMLTVEQYLALPAAAEEVDSPEGYFRAVSHISGADPAAVLQRGVDAGAALGDDPAAGFAEVVARVTALLPSRDDCLVTTIAGGMRLSTYLPTRTFELVVHGLDIARAGGLPAEPPPLALRRTLDIASALAAGSGDGEAVLMALTGRAALRPGFSVLG